MIGFREVFSYKRITEGGVIMSAIKNNGDIIPFLKQKDYIMVNNDLGGGSFGKTVLLQDPFIDELFVAKKYEPENDSIKEKFYKNFLDEIKILYKLNHKNIVRIYNYYAYDKICTGYILMEYVDGTDLGTYIRDFYPPLESTSLDTLFSQIIDAFCYIEEHGIVHRDIREGNILVDKEGNIKIIDFGIGKISETTNNQTDSLMFQVNRAQADILPQEHYQGKYTSLTDMFYIAELFHRLISRAKHVESADFSYFDILTKMMQKAPEDRFSNFAEIKNTIGKHDFASDIQITDEDKKLYQSFIGPIYQSVSIYTEQPKFNSDPSLFVSKIQATLKSNLFETFITKNADVISSIVLSSYRYKNSVSIRCDDVRWFLDWFQKLSNASQKLVLSNISAKLTLIPIEIDDDELPF